MHSTGMWGCFLLPPLVAAFTSDAEAAFTNHRAGRVDHGHISDCDDRVSDGAGCRRLGGVAHGRGSPLVAAPAGLGRELWRRRAGRAVPGAGLSEGPLPRLAVHRARGLAEPRI